MLKVYGAVLRGNRYQHRAGFKILPLKWQQILLMKVEAKSEILLEEHLLASAYIVSLENNVLLWEGEGSTRLLCVQERGDFLPEFRPGLLFAD